MPKKASEVDKIMDLLRAEFKLAPWWAGPIGIGIAYLLFYFVIPFVAGLVGGSDDSPVKITVLITKVCQMGAPFVAGAVGLVWIIALIDKLNENQRLDRQSGIDTIRELSWREFEQLLATAYERQGYRVTDTGQTHGPGSNVAQKLVNRSGAAHVFPIAEEHYRCDSIRNSKGQGRKASIPATRRFSSLVTNLTHYEAPALQRFEPKAPGHSSPGVLLRPQPCCQPSHY